MAKGRHRHPDTLTAPISEWIADTWAVIWHTLTRAPMPRTVNAGAHFPHPIPFDADK